MTTIYVDTQVGIKQLERMLDVTTALDIFTEESYERDIHRKELQLLEMEIEETEKEVKRQIKQTHTLNTQIGA